MGMRLFRSTPVLGLLTLFTYQTALAQQAGCEIGAAQAAIDFSGFTSGNETEVNRGNAFSAAKTGYQDINGNNIVTRLKFNWDLGNGVTTDFIEFYYTYTQPGVYRVTLTVTEPCGRSDDTYMYVTVTPTVPDSDFSAEPLIDLGEETIVDLRAKDTQADSMLVDWGDGSQNRAQGALGFRPRFTHTYSQPGTHKITLAAANSKYNDDNGWCRSCRERGGGGCRCSSVSTRYVQVLEPTPVDPNNRAPQFRQGWASAVTRSCAPTGTGRERRCTFRLGNPKKVYDPDGAFPSLSWQFEAKRGTAFSPLPQCSANAEGVCVFPAPGRYRVTLAATDNAGGSTARRFVYRVR
jgi:hypothetical protein